MRSTILAIAVVFPLVLHGQNLIQNPGFEIGGIPNNADQVAFATGWSKNCGRYFASNIPNGNPGSPDLFDTRSPNCLYQIPANKWGIRPTRAGGFRYVGMSGSTTTNGPAYFAETVEGTLTSPLDSCTYEVSFWASAVDGIKSQCNDLIGGVPPHPDNRIEVVLRKGNSCSTGKSVYVSSTITSGNWQFNSGQFTLTAADVAAGYDRIEFRLTQVTAIFPVKFHIVYLDDVSLEAKGQATLNPDFQLSAIWTAGNTSTYQLTATNAGPPPSSGFWWKVEELSVSTGQPVPNTAMTNPAQWWSNPTTNVFQGYYNNNAPVGKFLIDHKYRITRGMWSTCAPWTQSTKTVFMGNN